MTQLVLLNGPPGVGKSTIARALCDAHPLSLCLDIDVVRSMVGGWEADRLAAGERARVLALEMARQSLADGHLVVVPQFLGRLPFIEALGSLAEDCSVDFVEIMLLVPAAEARARFASRTARAETLAHVDSGKDIAATGGNARLDEMYALLESVRAARPNTIVIEPTLDVIDATVRAVQSHLA